MTNPGPPTGTADSAAPAAAAPAAAAAVTAPAPASRGTKRKTPPASSTASTPQRSGGGSRGSSRSQRNLKRAEGHKNRVKTANWTEEEDVILCKAFVNATTNPIDGVEQKGHEFWGQIFEAYMQLMAQEGRPIPEGRTQKAASRRFYRQIQPQVNVFIGALRQAKATKPSGTSEEDIQELAEFMYSQRQGGNAKTKPWMKQHCFDVLRVIPKYDPGQDASLPEFQDNVQEGVEGEVVAVDDSSANDEGTSNGVPSVIGERARSSPTFSVESSTEPTAGAIMAAAAVTSGVMGASMRRPMGTKAAKRASSAPGTGGSLGSVTDRSSAPTVKVEVSSIDFLAQEFRDYNQGRKKDKVFNRLKWLHDDYKAEGQLEEAKQVKGQMRALIFEEQAELALPNQPRNLAGNLAAAAGNNNTNIQDSPSIEVIQSPTTNNEVIELVGNENVAAAKTTGQDDDDDDFGAIQV